MQANFIELPAPGSDHYPAFAQRVEDLPSEAFPAERVVETLHLPRPVKPETFPTILNPTPPANTPQRSTRPLHRESSHEDYPVNPTPLPYS
jgi:hypothetical protein